MDYIRFVCWHCQTSLITRHRGKQGRCPKCKGEITSPRGLPIAHRDFTDRIVWEREAQPGELVAGLLALMSPENRERHWLRKKCCEQNGKQGAASPFQNGDAITKQLSEIKASLDLLVQQRTVKESYTPQELAGLLNRRPYTVREWCRLGRINAEKCACGRGGEREWRIPHEEVLRFQREGLLPIPAKY